MTYIYTFSCGQKRFPFDTDQDFISQHSSAFLKKLEIIPLSKSSKHCLKSVFMPLI